VSAPPDPLAAIADALADRVAARVLEKLGDLQPAEQYTRDSDETLRAARPALLTVEQACAELNVSRTTLHRLRGEGMAGVILIGDSPRIIIAEAIAWLRERGSADGGAA
jgi:hypothetical protein